MSTPTAYVVTKGSYSDYHILAVFLDEQEADAYARFVNRNLRKYEDPADVEEFAIADGTMRHIPQDLTPFAVYFYPEDSPRGQQEPCAAYKQSVPHTPDAMIFQVVGDRVQTISVYARDEEHALKIAQDKRAQWLADQAGIQ